MAIYTSPLSSSTEASHFAASVPEPITGLQLAIGATALVGLRRARRK